MKVLIADDSVISRHLLEATLRKWDYEVVVASDGTRAWEVLQREDAPRLAILDWMMPGLTGLEICRRVRGRGREPYIYILLLTSRSLKEDLIEGMQAGADDYVTKPFDQHELDVRLRAGRRIVELQTELLATREALRDQATHDALTAIWNRPAILEALHRELARSSREGRPVGVLLADLDHFKSVNDTHGHIAGDAVLRESVRRMQASMRAYDSIGRYGGEEFLIILPGCDEHATSTQGERMRQAVSREPMKLGEASIVLTVSLGGTAAPGGCSSKMESLIRAADEALYTAKKDGRNRTAILSLTAVAAALATEQASH